MPPREPRPSAVRAAASRAAPAALPPRDGPLVGRGEDLAALEALFAGGAPLVTVAGAAGVGKTRLALEHAHDRPRGSVWLCDLSEAVDAASVCASVARSLEIPAAGAAASARPGDSDDDDPDDPDDPVAPAATRVGLAVARRGRVLVVLDNFEQAVAHAGATVGRWLALAPEARWLVTSQERLRLPAERVLELAPLALPAAGSLAAVAGSAAVQLFVARAQRVRSRYALTAADAPAVAELVRQLDGIPLAIELAAARMGVMDPAALLARLAARFELLAHGARGAHARHRTLRAAIDGAWSLLAPAERAALAQCAVFRGGFSLEAAEAVVDLSGLAETPPPSAVDALQGLRDKSLLRASADGAGPLRLGLYASVRDYAAEKLALSAGDAAAARARHAAHYVTAAEALAARIDLRGGAAPRRLLLADRDNLLAVAERALAAPSPGAHDATVALRALVALDRALWLGGPFDDHAARLDAAIAAAGAVSGVAPGVLARALLARATVRRRLGRFDAGLADLDALAPLLAPPDAVDPRERVVLRAHALRARGAIEFERGRPVRSLAALEQALALFRAAGDAVYEAVTLANLANALRELGRVAEAEEHYGRALALHERVSDAALVGTTLYDLGTCRLKAGRWRDARGCLERALGLHREAGNRWFEGLTLGSLALLEQAEGRLDAAAERYDRALGVVREAGCTTLFEGICRGYLGALRLEQGAVSAAREDLWAACGILEGAGERRLSALFRAYLAGVEATEGRAEETARALEAASRGGPAARTRDGDSGGTDGPDAVVREVVALQRAYAELALARHRGAVDGGGAGELAAARAALAVARARGEDGVASRSVDAHLVLRLLAGVGADGRRAGGDGVRADPGTSVARRAGDTRVVAAPPPDALVVHPEGLWFRVAGGPVVRCHRRRTIARLLAALVEQRVRAPGRPVAARELIRAGWPDERILPAAAGLRLRVALSTLRKLGLRDPLLAAEDGSGYLLDPGVPLRVATLAEGLAP